MTDVLVLLAREYANVSSNLCADLRVPKDLRDELAAHTAELLNEMPARVHRAVDPTYGLEKDSDDISDELDMPGIAESLEGILEYDVTIVSAWEWHDHGDGVRVRERVFPVRGSKNAGHVIDGETVPRAISG